MPNDMPLNSTPNHLPSPLSSTPVHSSADRSSQSGSHSAHTGSSRRLLWFVVIPAVLCIWGLLTWAGRRKQEQSLQSSTAASVALPVTLMQAKAGNATDQLTLPATLQALDDAPLYPRVSGYVRSWYADIGKHVRAGQLLAIIDSPEVDHQLARSQAVLTQYRSNLALAGTTNQRYQELIKSNSVAQQEVDQTSQNLAAQQSNVTAAEADVAQLQQQQQYERIVAPFDGTVTQRRINIGDLVNAGNSGVGSELFHVARTNIMRIFVSVPEAYSQQIRLRDPVGFNLTALPGQTFTGAVVRTDHAIDLSTRTLLVEVDVPNPGGKLIPGAYGQVHFTLPAAAHLFLIPTGTVLFQAAGPQVAVVDSANHVHLRKVSIGRDLGNNVEIASGVSATDHIIANPPDFLVEGMLVAPQAAAAPPASAGGSPPAQPAPTPGKGSAQ